MSTHIVFCSATDRNVSLVPRSPELIWHIVLDRQPFGDVVCENQGRTCTGAMCPFSAETTTGGDLEEASRSGPLAPN